MGRSKKPSSKAPKRARADREALREAFAGVKPLRGGARRVMPKPEPSGTRPSRPSMESVEVLHVEHDRDGAVIGRRAKTHQSIVDALENPNLEVEAECDLHRLTVAEANREILRFVAEEQREGRRWVLIITGKGLHSPGGKGALQSAVVEALSRGAAARYVLAFRTAPRRYGGAGAIAVRLRDRV